MNATARRLFPRALILLWFPLLACILAAPDALELPNRGDFLVRNTIRLSLLYWSIAAFLMIRDDALARAFWTLACTAYLVHVGVSFEHVHRWSHAAAFNHVEDASGYGAGIFVSYFFTLLWPADVLWWWLAPVSHRERPRWLDWSLHGFMVFIIINGTVIFEQGAIRWVSAVTLLALGSYWLWSRPLSRRAQLRRRPT